MKTFTQFLTEDVSASVWEQCLCIAYNGGYDRAPDTFGIPRATYDGVALIADRIAQDVRRVTRAARTGMEHFGKGSGKMVPWWKGKGTPKTDCYIGPVHLSLKKQGGSQIMSARGDETKSTFTAAINYMGKSAPKGVLALVSQLEPVLKTIKVPGNIDTMVAVSRGKMSIPSKITAPNSSGVMSTVKIDKKAYAKKVEEFVDWKSSMKKITPIIAQWFETQPEFKMWFTFEAATGHTKFAPDQFAWANWVVEFDAATGMHNFIHPLSVNGHPSDYVKQMAHAATVRITPKTGSGKQMSGGLGTTDTSFRLDNRSVDECAEYLDSRQTLREWCEVADAQVQRMVLSEDSGDPGLLARAYHWVSDMVQRLVSKLYELARQGYHAILSFFEFEPESVDVTGLELFGY